MPNGELLKIMGLKGGPGRGRHSTSGPGKAHFGGNDHGAEFTTHPKAPLTRSAVEKPGVQGNTYGRDASLHQGIHHDMKDPSKDNYAPFVKVGGRKPSTVDTSYMKDVPADDPNRPAYHWINKNPDTVTEDDQVTSNPDGKGNHELWINGEHWATINHRGEEV